MNFNISKFGKCLFLAIAMFFCCLCSGCDLYDWLVAYIQKAFASDHDYEVSVIDCNHLQKPDAIFTVDSALSNKLNSGIRQGVRDVAANSKYRNISLTDSIPEDKFADFHKEFFAEGMTMDNRIKLLRQYCETYNTNIIICGATMGDDYNIAFIGWLYRRDLDYLSQTEVKQLQTNTSERVQEKIVQDSIRELLEKSLDDNPIGLGGAISSEMAENKDVILKTSGTALLILLQAALSGGGGY